MAFKSQWKQAQEDTIANQTAIHHAMHVLPAIEVAYVQQAILKFSTIPSTTKSLPIIHPSDSKLSPDTDIIHGTGPSGKHLVLHPISASASVPAALQSIATSIATNRTTSVSVPSTFQSTTAASAPPSTFQSTTAASAPPSTTITPSTSDTNNTSNISKTVTVSTVADSKIPIFSADNSTPPPLIDDPIDWKDRQIRQMLVLNRWANRICNTKGCGSFVHLKRCTICDCTWYCSKQCRLLDRKIHEAWCANSAATVRDLGPLATVFGAAPSATLSVVD